MPKQQTETFPTQDAYGQWRWADGTAPTINEWRGVYTMVGNPDYDGSKLGNEAERNAWSTLKLQSAGDFATREAGKDVLDNALPKLVGPETPGAELETGPADQEQAALQALLADLQQQAATGGGAWEDSLRSATEQASASAMALGQTQQQQTGGSMVSALGNIGNAQGSAQQRAVGQGNILRARSKQSAQNAITGVTSAMGNSAAEQSAATAAARRAVQATNQSLIDQAEKREMNRADAIGSMGQSGGMSEGGEVPGRAPVFGDDTANDIVPAKLSPGEIVIPRTIAQAPNAPELAAAFVMALQQREQQSGGVESFADGGQTPGYDPDTGLKQTTVKDDYGSGNAALSFILPHIGRMAGFGELRKKYLGPKRPSVESGGLLETENYDAARNAQLQNAATLGLSARGRGPSVAPQMMQNTSDSNMEAALQGQAAGRGVDLNAVTAAQQGAAGQAAGVVAQEQASGQAGLAEALADQQQRDIAFARAGQQAAWQQTMLNVGLGLEQQALVDNILSGAGQGLSAISDIDFRGDGSRGGGDDGGDEFSFSTEDGNSGPGDEPSDYGGGDDGGDDRSFGPEDGNSGGYAHGGVIHAAAMAYGGKVPGYAGGGPIPGDAGGYVDPLTAMEMRFQAPVTGFLRSPAGEIIPIPAAPESGTATYTPPGEAPVAVENPNAMAMAMGAAPMRSGAAGESPGQRILGAMRPALGEPSARQVESNLINAPTDAGMAAQKKRAELGISREMPGPAAAPPAPEIPPAIAPQPTRVGMVSTKDPGLATSLTGLEQEKSAEAMKAEAAAAAGAEKAKYLQGFQEQMQAHEAQQTERRNLAAVQTQDMLARNQAAMDEFKNISTTVDPGRYWASKSTGQKILGALGLALGALGAGKDGINKSAVMIQNAIDRDLEAQKAQAQASLAKGRASMDAAANSYAQMRQNFQDEAAADAAWKAGAFDMAKVKLQELEASASAPAAKAQAQATAALLEQEKGEQMSQAGKYAQEVNYKNQTLALEAKKMDMAKGGGGMDQKQQAQVMEIAEREKEIQQSGSELLRLIGENGTAEKWAPGVEAKMNQAINGMIIASAKMQDREGVVREPDEMREKKSLGFEPGFWQRSESAKESIKSYMANAERRRNNALSVRGLR